ASANASRPMLCPAAMPIEFGLLPRDQAGAIGGDLPDAARSSFRARRPPTMARIRPKAFHSSGFCLMKRASRRRVRISAAISQPRGCGGDEVVEPDRVVGPFELVALVADGEVEAPAAAPDGVADEVAQVCGAGTEARDIAVVVARQHVIIGTAKD